MTTEYTHPVAEGRHTTIEQYAWHCSEAFFHDGNVTAGDTEFESREVKHAEAEVERLTNLSDDEVSADWSQKLTRNTAMLEKVRAWEPPTARHKALKLFMEEQLVFSIKFDCGGEPFIQKSPTCGLFGWRSLLISQAKQALVRAQEEYAKEQARFVARKTYLDALTDVLGPRPGRTP